MNLEDMILISVDDHVVEPPEMFDQHMTQKELDTIAPRLVEENGKNFWLYEGQKIGNMGLNAVVGRVPEEYGVEPTSYDQLRKGCYDVHARVADMNANGSEDVVWLLPGGVVKYLELFPQRPNLLTRIDQEGGVGQKWALRASVGAGR